MNTQANSNNNSNGARIRSNPRVKVSEKTENYFKNKPNKSKMMFNKRKKSKIGGQNWLFYTYWILGGIALIAIFYLVDTIVDSKGASAKLIYQEGPVFVRHGAGSDDKTVETDTKLKNMDQIITQEGARAIIKFEDETLIRMKEKTRIILTSEGDDIVILQTDGNAYHRVAKNEQRKYKVELTSIEGVDPPTVEAMGTAFWTEKKQGSSEIAVGVIENKVKYSKSKVEEPIEIEEGQKIKIAENDKSKVEISNDDIKESFIYWNIQQDEKMNMPIGPVITLKYSAIKNNGGLDENQNQIEIPSEQTEDDDETEESADESIKLTAEATSEGVELSWTLSDVEAENGFKVLKGPSENPEYPGDSFYRSFKSPNQTSYTWNVNDGKNHHFRVCIVNDTLECEIYSNDVEVEAKKSDALKAKEDCVDSDGEWDEDDEVCECPEGEELNDEGSCTEKIEEEPEEEEEDTEDDTEEEDEEEEVSYADSISIDDARSKDKGEATIQWSISGGEAPDGFMIIRKKEKKDPRYPNDEHLRVSSPEARSFTWEDEDTEGENYYFVVCIYNAEDDKCEVYSNDEDVDIDD